MPQMVHSRHIRPTLFAEHQHYEGELVQVSVGSSVYAGTVCAVSEEHGVSQCKIRWEWSGFKPSWVNASDILDLHSMGTDRRGRRTSKRDRHSTPLPAYERTVAAEQQRRLEFAACSSRNEMSSARQATNSSRQRSKTEAPARSMARKRNTSLQERRSMFQEDFDVLPRGASASAHAVSDAAAASAVHSGNRRRRRGQKRARSSTVGQSRQDTPTPASLLSIRVGVDPPSESMSRWLLTVAAATAVPSLRSSLMQKLCLDAAIVRVKGLETPSAADFAEAYRRGWAVEALPYVFRQVGFLVFVQLHCDGLLCGAEHRSSSSAALSAPPGSVASARLPALLSLWNSCLLWQAVPPSVWLQGWLPLTHAMVLLEWAACSSVEQQDAVLERMVLLPVKSVTPDGGRLPPAIREVITQSMDKLQQLLVRVRSVCQSGPTRHDRLELPCAPAAAVWASQHSGPAAGAAAAARPSSASSCSDHASMAGSVASSWISDLRLASSPRRSQHTAARVLACSLFDTLTATQMSPSDRDSNLDALAQRLALAAHTQCVLAAGRLSALARAALCVQGTKNCVPQLLKNVPCDESVTRSAFDQLISSSHTAKCLLTWHRCKRQDSGGVTAVLCSAVLEDPSQWANTLALCEQALPGAPPAYHQFRSGLPDSPIAVMRPAGEWRPPHGSTVLDTVEASIGPAAVCAD